MNAILLAAGKSTRTYPLTLTRPKALLPIANEPILVHQLRALKGIVEVLARVPYLGQVVVSLSGEADRDQYEQMRSLFDSVRCMDGSPTTIIWNDGDRVKELAKPGGLIETTCEITIKPVRYCCHCKGDRGCPM